MPVIRKVLFPIFAAGVFAAATVLLPSPALAKPKHVTTLKLPSGSTVQKMNNSQFRVRNGLGIGGTYSCSCSDTGSCSTVQTEGVLQCGKDGDSCKGTCDMSTTTGGGGKIMMKRN